MELALGHLALEEPTDPIPCPVEGPGDGVQESDFEPSFGRDLRDPCPHRPGAQDPDPRDLGQGAAALRFSGR
jgi:hypothetical protein